MPLRTPRVSRKQAGLVAGVSLLVLTAAGWSVWRAHAVRDVRPLVPTSSELSPLPPELADALRSAAADATAASTSVNGVAELGRLYQANNLLDHAESCWRWLLQHAPRDGHWSYYLADIARTKGDDAAMAARLRETVSIAPEYATAWLKLAEWEFKTGEVDQAEHDYRRRLELVPGDPYARLGLARVALARNAREEARKQIESIVRDHPTFYPASNLLAQMLEEGGDPERAKATRKLGRDALRFREADDPWMDELKERCFDVSQLALWASIELTTNHGDHGAALLERAIRIAPENPTGYTSLGQVYLQLHNPSRAQDMFARAITLPGAPADAYAGLSQADRDLGQPEKAEQAARLGTERYPDDGNLETALGNSLRAAGRIEDAIVAYARAAKAAPNLAETHFNLGSALLQQNRIADAARSLKRALELKSDYPPALLALGRLSLTTNDIEAAGRYARALYAGHPEMPDARQLMGLWCLQAGTAAAKAGRLAEAEQRLREGIAASPELPELHARLGVLYGQEGRAADALPPLEKYHQLAPNEAMSALFLGQAYLQLGKPDAARPLLRDAQMLAQQNGEANVAAACRRLLQTLPE